MAMKQLTNDEMLQPPSFILISSISPFLLLCLLYLPIFCFLHDGKLIPFFAKFLQVLTCLPLNLDKILSKLFY